MIKERILFLDVAKALCIILVVVGHYVPAYSPDWYMGLHDVIYTFHMPLFMFASGYIYMATRKETDYGSFLMRKVRRLLVPYLTVSVLIISIKLVMQGDAYVENPVSAMSYVRMFYLPEAGYFLWFIWALWWMFVLVPLCKTRNARCLLWVASVVLKCLPVQFPELFCLEQFKNMFVFFMTGVLVCESRAAHAFVSQCKWAQAFVAVCLFAVVEKLHFSENLVWGGVKIHY